MSFDKSVKEKKMKEPPFLIGELLKEASRPDGVSDVHLIPDFPAVLRVLGELESTGRILTEEELKEWADYLFSTFPENFRKRLFEKLEKDGGVSFAYQEGRKRYRVALNRLDGSFELVFRILPEVPPKLEGLGLYKKTEERLKREIDTLSNAKKGGLVIIAGPTGSGKSTTLAAVVREILKFPLKVSTLEDPIEYRYDRIPERHKNSVVVQRELFRDFPTFAEGLYQALRSDPNVMVVGEIRDPKSGLYALNAAASGHLVLTTIHAERAVEAITVFVNKVKEVMSADEARTQLAFTLRAVIAQKLVRSGGKRYLVHEALFPGLGERSQIKAGDEGQIVSLLDNSAEGSISFGLHGAHLSLDKGVNEAEIAGVLNLSPEEFREYVEKARRRRGEVEEKKKNFSHGGLVF